MAGLGKTAWVDSIFKIAWPALVRATDPAWLPRAKITKTRVNVEEYGCGHYGCVMPTQAIPGVVVKLTTDPSEAAFVAAALHIGQDEDAGLVRYVGIYQIPGTMHRGRPVYVLWREEAQDVGKVFDSAMPFSHKNDYESRSLQALYRYLEKFQIAAADAREVLHRAKSPTVVLAEAAKHRDRAWDRVSELDIESMPARPAHAEYYGNRQESLLSFLRRYRGPERLAVALRVVAVIAELMENAYLCDAIGREFSSYLEHGLLLADVHAGNIGRVDRMGSIPVITDPGHAVALDPRWQSITVPVLPV